MLKEKYKDLIAYGQKLRMNSLEATEAEGKLKIRGTAAYQMEKDMFWDKLKSYSTWMDEVGADIKVEHTDLYGYYTVKPGDSLSKIAKWHLGDPMAYPKIFEANKDQLTNPDLIKVGQTLKLPNR